MKPAAKHIILLMLLYISSCQLVQAKKDRDSLLQVLDGLLANKEAYMQAKEQEIRKTKELLRRPGLNLRQTYDIYFRLQDAYKKYLSDSSIFYLRKSLLIAEQLQDRHCINETKFSLASVYAQAGMYMESLDILKSADAQGLTAGLRMKYYEAYKQLYSYYAIANVDGAFFYGKSFVYRDSLLRVLDPASNYY